MRRRANPKFWKFYDQLPEEIRELADSNYELLKNDSRHPSLHFKKVGRMWSARVGIHCRAVAGMDPPDEWCPFVLRLSDGGGAEPGAPPDSRLRQVTPSSAN